MYKPITPARDKLLRRSIVGKKDKMPTEREWLLMEAIWDGEEGITSSEILKRVHAKICSGKAKFRGRLNRVVRVMM